MEINSDEPCVALIFLIKLGEQEMDGSRRRNAISDI